MEFIRKPSEEEIDNLLPQWTWLVPPTATPLMLSVFGDWLFGNPDGSLSVLSLLEGTYEQVAESSEGYNELNKSSEWCDEIFISSWFPIAIENDITPKKGECIGWQIHPIIGGEFSPNNLKIFSMSVYQALMSQLHAKIQGHGQ
ncbi:T6SS immunity protein Tdi1 domain-containing protein [Pseudoalteromonas sp. meg-B1]|uniref:T6SS immunity protein Tdi1 domain-containing protein n=1 Tax=Pseudoalteromonas sp. meg-B1 TaxID=2203192 RepID=UPI000D6EB122|nr:T6SS immunity protein Tdi1 domain-containing protein [Pseudoalteromonas sp. meg-B1]PWS55958.1 hypothetical protein DK924_04245 [Pseudoalteromonas sp. meg-B1]